MPGLSMITATMKSVLFTKGVASRTDRRQAIPTTPTIPDEDVRKLAAQLVLEEALETVHALGFVVRERYEEGRGYGFQVTREGIPDPKNLDGIIDGCCDLIYVATGALAACGVPDEPHLKEVCRANDAKFPAGRAIIDPNTGKYLKPQGWRGPDHGAVALLTEGANLYLTAEHLIATNSVNGGHS